MATPTNLPAAFTTGAILTAAQQNDLRGAFRILQVVQGTHSTLATNSTSTFADTGLTATITPQSTSSKILVLVNQASCAKTAGNTQSHFYMQLLRGATSISIFEGSAGYTNTSSDNYIGTISTVFLDSPATTSATTYKTQFRNNVNAASVTCQVNGVTSTITLLEVSA
jgi:hypothetical protein